MKFGTYDVRAWTSDALWTRYRIEFPNGYGASIVQGPYSYGGSEGLWEVAILHHGSLTYDTPLTDDVLGSQTEDEVAEILRQVEALS